DVRRGREREVEADDKRDQETDHEFREALPDFPRAGLVGRAIDVIGPDVTENKGPYPDKDVDEHLDRRSGTEDPARLIFDSFGSVLREDQRLCDRATGDGRAVGFDGKTHPGASHERLRPQTRGAPRDTGDRV